MATHNSTIAVKQASPSLGNRNDPRYERGELRRVAGSYTMLGTEAQGDFLKLVNLPKGAMVIPHLSRVGHLSTLATTATLDVGDDDVLGVGAAADADRYCDGIDIAAAGVDAFATGVADATKYVLGADSWIIAEFKTLVTPVAGVILQWELYYVLPN